MIKSSISFHHKYIHHSLSSLELSIHYFNSDTFFYDSEMKRSIQMDKQIDYIQNKSIFRLENPRMTRNTIVNTEEYQYRFLLKN